MSLEPYTPIKTAPSVHGELVTLVMVAGSEIEDGGKWALYCDHADDSVFGLGCTGVLQDTNRRRLWQFARHSNEWCPYCQEIER
jgi:hypothetical protein